MNSDSLKVYQDLGVKPVINAMGFMTVLGGSRPSPGVQAAMNNASRYFADMEQLLKKTERIDIITYRPLHLQDQELANQSKQFEYHAFKTNANGKRGQPAGDDLDQGTIEL